MRLEGKARGKAKKGKVMGAAGTAVAVPKDTMIRRASRVPGSTTRQVEPK